MTKPRIRPIPSTVTTVDLATGEQTTRPMSWGLMPPPAGKCQVCAAEHEPENAHNAQSIYYQMAFHAVTGRAATWADAVAHCAPHVQAQWKDLLASHNTGNRWTEPPAGVAPVKHLGEQT